MVGSDLVASGSFGRKLIPDCPGRESCSRRFCSFPNRFGAVCRVKSGRYARLGKKNLCSTVQDLSLERLGGIHIEECWDSNKHLT